MTEMTLLHPADPFPVLTIALPGGHVLRLPHALAGHFGVILFYRGSWCPYCNAQLRAFQRSLDHLTDLDVLVAALSVDDEATTQELIAKHGLGFPVGYSADVSAISAATGAFVNDDPVYLQSTGFVLDPRAESSSACVPAAPSDGSSMRTSSGWWATKAAAAGPVGPGERGLLRSRLRAECT